VLTIRVGTWEAFNKQKMGNSLVFDQRGGGTPPLAKVYILQAVRFYYPTGDYGVPIYNPMFRFPTNYNLLGQISLIIKN
jgi:hypothetical protein